MDKKEVNKMINPFPQINFLLDTKIPPKEAKNYPLSPSPKDEDFEEQEELKDNIAFMDIGASRKPSRMVPKNPYSILQQPIMKRFSNNLSVRDSLTPRGSALNVKSDQSLPNFVNRLSDLAVNHSDSLFVSPKDRQSLYDELSKKKARLEKEDYSIYDGKTRNSLITNIDDFLRSFSLNQIVENDGKSQVSGGQSRRSKLSDKDQVEATVDENLFRNFGEEAKNLALEERKMLYEYLIDFMVMSIDKEANEMDDDNNFLIDEETEKLQKELNDIPGLYKKLKGTGTSKECEFLQVQKMNELEKIRIDYEYYPDDFPCLNLRKNFLMIAKYVYNLIFFIKKFLEERTFFQKK